MSDSEAPRRNGNGSLDVKSLLQWLPIVGIIFTAGITYNGYDELRQETATLRARAEQQAAIVAENGRQQAVMDGRLGRSESDGRDVAGKLERLSEQQSQMNRRLDVLCAALGKPCQP